MNDADLPDPPDAAASAAGQPVVPPALRQSLWAGGRQRIERLKGPIVAFAAVGTVLGGLAGWWNGYRVVSGTPAAQHPASSPIVATIPAEALSILVLPLANQTGDPAKAYLADGLTTAITADLSRLRGAIVVPPLTAVALQSKGLTLPQLGSEARVRFVLQGALLTSGDRLRLQAHLHDTVSGTQLWSRGFETPMGDLFALQDELTGRVRASVGPQMIVRAAREAESRRQMPQVADLLLRVQALQLQEQSVASLKGMEALCRQVLAIEPANAAALAGLAVALSMQRSNFVTELAPDPATRRDLGEQAKALASEALRVDPENVQMLNLLASQAWVAGDFEGAQRLYARSLDLDPGYAATYNNMGVMYRDMGKNALARENITKAMAMPSYIPRYRSYFNLSTVALQEGNYDDAVQMAHKALEGSPDVVAYRAQLAIAQALQGDAAGAQRTAAALMRVAPGFRLRRPEELDAPRAWYREHFEKRLEPAARLAGLPIDP